MNSKAFAYGKQLKLGSRDIFYIIASDVAQAVAVQWLHSRQCGVISHIDPKLSAACACSSSKPEKGTGAGVEATRKRDSLLPSS